MPPPPGRASAPRLSTARPLVEAPAPRAPSRAPSLSASLCPKWTRAGSCGALAKAASTTERGEYISHLAGSSP
ncbi:MAG: hypothetical protein ACK55Z_18340, partial [bacterium]